MTIATKHVCLNSLLILIGSCAFSLAQKPPAGEDLGQNQNAQAGLARQIQLRMEDAHRCLLRRDSSQQTQEIQQKILTELESLLAGQRKSDDKAAQSPGKSAAKSPPKSAGQSQKAETANATQAAERSRNALNSKGLRGIWGHFPPKTQQQLKAIRVDQFVPRYRSQIEEFYKKLGNRLVDPP